MRIWLLQKGFGALKRGGARIFAKMLLVLLLIIYSQVEEGVLYFIWRVRQGLKGKRVLKINGYQILTLSGDRGISRELAAYGFREKSITDYLKRTINKYDNCLDIGANLGYYALLESKKASEGVIYGFEPDKDNFSVLCRNVVLNASKNVILYNMAIARDCGNKDFYLYPKRNWSSFNDRIGYRYFSKVRVEAISLDRFYSKISKKINLIRMDVEGYESNVICGGKKMLRQADKLRIVMEIHPHLAPEKELKGMLSTLRKSGFMIEAIALELPPRWHKHLRYINSFREDVGVLPFGILPKKYLNFEALEGILIDRDRGFNYYPHVVFKK